MTILTFPCENILNMLLLLQQIILPAGSFILSPLQDNSSSPSITNKIQSVSWVSSSVSILNFRNIKILPGYILHNCSRKYAPLNTIFPLFLLFSKKYKVILLFICVLTFYIGSVSDIFSSYPSKRPVSSSLYAILYFFHSLS